MRNVIRPPMPVSLRENADSWRRDLLDALSSPEPDPKWIKQCKNRYKKDDVCEALEEMYNGLCCYCEGRIGAVAFEEIEHRRPKSLYPEYTFEWDNLHLACPRCNRAKGKKWNDEHPILDSCHDNISEHLSYRLGEAGPKRWSESYQGTTTIEHTDLNRQKLIDARTECAFKVLHTIGSLNNDPHSPSAGLERADLEGQVSGAYGSLIQWLLSTYLRNPDAPAS